MCTAALRSLVLFGAFAAHADAIDVQLTAKAELGKGAPVLAIRILEPIAGYQVQLKRGDGQTLDVKGGGRPGQTRTIELMHPEGKEHWVGGITINYPRGGDAYMPLDFETAVAGKLDVRLDKSADLDVAARTVRFQLRGVAEKVSMRVEMDTGKLAFDGDVADAPEKNAVISASWPEADGRVMHVTLTAVNAVGAKYTLELTPWRIDIPHEELLFDSGKADVRAVEASKLDAAYRLIAEHLAKYGHLAKVRLFIAGHTDSVGPTAMNRALSVRRAQAIAAYFRKAGLQVPIFYEGFGEEALVVHTPDETDEPKNRRAEYILSIDDPVVTNARVPPVWKRL